MFVPWLTVMPTPATKSSSSSWVMPLMTGTRANCPRASAVPIGWMSTEPSTTPGISTPKSLTRSLTDALRRHAALWSGQPTAVANASPAASAAGAGRDHLGQHRQAAGRLARDGHVVRIAAEARDVALDPAQCRLLVHQPVVAGRAARPGGERRVGEEAERAEAVVDRHDDGAGRRELGAVIVAGSVLDETSAVDPHQHGPAALIVTTYRRGVDVQV